MRTRSGTLRTRPPTYRLEQAGPMRDRARVTTGKSANSRQAAGKAVRVRRIALGMRSQQALADAAAVDVKTVGKIERGEKVGENSLIAIDIALDWTPGRGVAALLAGEQPEDRDKGGEPEQQSSEPDPGDYPDELQYMIAVRRYLRTGLGLSETEVDRGWQMARAVLERRAQSSSVDTARDDVV